MQAFRNHIVPASFTLLSAALAAGLIAGCQQAASVTPSAASVSQAADMVPDTIKSSVTGYLSSMTDVNKVLANVNSTEQALSAVPVLTPYVSKTSEYTAILNKLSPEAKSAVTKSFGDKLAATNTEFTKQSQRIAADPGKSSALGGLLGKLSMFK